MWAKSIVRLEDTPQRLALSVVFTWQLPEARGLCLRETQREVIVGGPAVKLMPAFLADCATVGEHWPMALQAHNEAATRTTSGCKRGCRFCGVAQIEGEFRELENWTPAPVVCDSNFLQSSNEHFNRAIDRLKQVPQVDFNQGLDARLLTAERAERLCELDLVKCRFAWDSAACEGPVMRAVEIMRAAGLPKSHIECYCLVNFGETQDEATYRLQTLKDAGLRGFPMRYQPLDALEKNSHVAPQWDGNELKRFLWYWSRQAWLAGVNYEDCSWNVRARNGQTPLFAEEAAP
jgi:hypothetical protein